MWQGLENDMNDGPVENPDPALLASNA